MTYLAHDGPQALTLIAQHAHNLDVIILDYHMPGMTGLEVVQELRQTKQAPTVPILLFTGDQRTALEDQARELGVDRVLYKPLVPAQVLAAVQQVVGVAPTRRN